MTVYAPPGISPYGSRSAEWTASTAYVVGQLVSYSGSLYEVTTAHTSTTLFDATKFTAIGSGEPVARTGLDFGTNTIDPTTGLPVIVYTSLWGIRSDYSPYFDLTGVVTGDEAVLTLAPATGLPVLTRVVPLP